MRGLKLLLTSLGRISISIIFILSAFNKILDWQGTERGLVNAFCDWSSYLNHAEGMQKLCTDALPFVTTILIVTTVIELLGGLLVLFGLKTRLGAFFLVLILISTTILFHQFWFLEGIQREVQTVLFLKNIAILGGLFYVLVYGSKVEKKKQYPLIENPDLNSSEGVKK